MIERERYAVVSCHVERPLDDRVWGHFSTLQARAPGGFRIAALMRPPDESAGEPAQLWLERAREAAARGPLGHHTHWGGPGQARPRGGAPAETVRREAAWLREEGIRPTLFCGGGWYIDADLAGALAQLGYADCTATGFRPRHLDEKAARLELDEPTWLTLAGGDRLLELPSTHSLGMIARAALRAGALHHALVHVYFHDTDLLVRRRATALRAALLALARRRRPADLDQVAAAARNDGLPVNAAFAP
jgi:hypothetical protein